MSEDGFRLLMNYPPLWQNPSPAAHHPVPSLVQQVYTVLGRTNNGIWHTVLKSTDDLHLARRTMEAANQSAGFDRLVIASGHSVNRAPAHDWTTFECALPVAASDFQKILTRVETRTANMNAEEKLAQIPGAFLLGEKQSQNLALSLAFILSVAQMNIEALAVTCLYATLETIFMLDSHPISINAARMYNRVRGWTYALLNGVLLYTLLV